MLYLEILDIPNIIPHFAITCICGYRQGISINNVGGQNRCEKCDMLLPRLHQVMPNGKFNIYKIRWHFFRSYKDDQNKSA